MDTKITFINKTLDENNFKVVIFQKSGVTNQQSTINAWKVIEHCGYNWSHEFIYSSSFSVGVKDSYNNNSNKKKAHPGQKWLVIHKPWGNTLELSKKKAANREEVEVKNDLQRGSIDAQIYKQGRVVVSKKGIPPEQKAIFKIEPYINVGVHSQVEEGDILSSAILSNAFTKFSLRGINEAQLIMTERGVGPAAMPFEFELVVIS